MAAGRDPVLAAGPDETSEPDPGPAASPRPSSTPTGDPEPEQVELLAVELPGVSALPSGATTVRGRGCPAGSAVVVDIGGRRAGEGRAGGDGSFEVELSLPDDVGRLDVRVRCGGRTIVTPLDLVVTSTGSPASGSVATSAAMVLAFLVLIGGALLPRGSAARTGSSSETPDAEG